MTGQVKILQKKQPTKKRTKNLKMLPFYRVVQEEQPALNFVAIQDDIERF